MNETPPLAAYRVMLPCGVFDVQAKSAQAAILRAQADALDGGALDGILAPLRTDGPGVVLTILAPDVVRKPGRPSLAPGEHARDYKSPLTLDGPIPPFIGYKDLKSLIKQLRGQMYDERIFKVWTERGHDVFGKCPSVIDGLAVGTAVPGVRRRKYRWNGENGVMAWILASMLDPDSPRKKPLG